MTRFPLAALSLLALGVAPIPVEPSRIAFASHRDGNWEIYAMDADGGRQTRLTTNDAQDRFPLWSPDRSKLAFGSQRNDRWELWVVEADGSNPRRLFTGMAAKAHRQWSPDGSRIVFESRLDGERKGDIYTVRADGTGLTRLTTSGDERNPAWSPDGTRIAFTSSRDGNP